MTQRIVDKFTVSSYLWANTTFNFQHLSSNYDEGYSCLYIAWCKQFYCNLTHMYMYKAVWQYIFFANYPPLKKCVATSAFLGCMLMLILLCWFNLPDKRVAAVGCARGPGRQVLGLDDSHQQFLRLPLILHSEPDPADVVVGHVVIVILVRHLV